MKLCKLIRLIKKEESLLDLEIQTMLKKRCQSDGGVFSKENFKSITFGIKKINLQSSDKFGKIETKYITYLFLNKLLQIGELIWKLDLNKYTKQLFTKFPRNCKDSIVGKPLWISLTVLLPGACLESLMKFPIDLMMRLKVWPIIYLNDIQGCRNRRTRRRSSPPPYRYCF